MSGTSERTANLPRPSVDQAPEGILDPADIPPDGAVVRIKRYANDDWGKVFVFVGTTYSNDLPVRPSTDDVEFYVEAQYFVAGADGVVIVRYEVEMRSGGTVPSDELELKLDAGFEGAATLDLTQQNYVAVDIKAPQVVPAYARMTRTATWGSSPHAYVSDNEYIASVDPQTGEVTARGNGECTITATDSLNQSRAYSLTVTGIRQVSFMSDKADWAGMKTVCERFGLDPVARLDLNRLRELYGNRAADYLGWLDYPFWTGEAVGAGTYWIYDLNTGDTTSADARAYHQALGISRSAS
ncbi:Ig-like domain-containing protein [Pseudomonas bijieensis]|uniref:Ig-like domain-containing protein n=1 Tax=Pseudomonas bijieensis TaxID=2681983 RepID=UPI001E2ABEB1|nr:Ig-like domain-containing protein [Pseudomonas bijieensis]MCD9116519.1 Ig-like domain-containing protein [Pseudomonas bijieensis]UQI32539.1 Ig-like domain-containing protein [Pseudomonas bijieensis]